MNLNNLSCEARMFKDYKSLLPLPNFKFNNDDGSSRQEIIKELFRELRMNCDKDTLCESKSSLCALHRLIKERLSISSQYEIKKSSRPQVIVLMGPTGVGKTYLAKKLAEYMFGSADDLIRIDMSEFTESFNVSRLVGAPPGYVGYEEGGQLTEKVRRHPYSIVLLDEIEKAHGNVFNLLLQVLDEGRLTDGNGRLVDFRNTVIIMTSNAGTRQLKEFGRGVGFNAGGALGLSLNESDKEHARSIIQKSLSRQFAPEFLNRLDEIITFDQLDLNAIKQIVEIVMVKFICAMIVFRIINLHIFDKDEFRGS